MHIGGTIVSTCLRNLILETLCIWKVKPKSRKNMYRHSPAMSETDEARARAILVLVELKRIGPVARGTKIELSSRMQHTIKTMGFMSC